MARWLKKRELPSITTQKAKAGRWVRPKKLDWRDVHVVHRRGAEGAPIGVDAQEKRAVSKDTVHGTLPERVVYKELLKRHIPFDFQSSLAGGRLLLGGMVADFILLDRNLIIRVQGSKWHTGYFNEIEDRMQAGILQAYGYDVVDVWDWQIEDPGLLEDWFRDNVDSGPAIPGGIVVTGSAEVTMDFAPQITELEGRVDMLEGALFNAVASPLVRIAAQNIQVSQLSAISANLGTVTAGTYKTSATVGEAADGQGILIDEDHIAAYDSSGDLQFEIDSATGVARTGTSAPYAQLSDAGLTVYSTNTSNSGLFLTNSTTSTTTSLRECMGGLAIVGDQTDAVVLRVYDTAYDPGATNLRYEFLASSGGSSISLRDNAEDEVFRLECVYTDGTVEFQGLDSGDLKLSSASGQVVFSCDIEPSANDTYYLGDYGKAFKGLIVEDKTDGKNYLITTDSGAIDVSEVTS